MPTSSLTPGVRGSGTLTSQAKGAQKKIEESRGKSAGCGITEANRRKDTVGSVQCSQVRRESKHVH